MKQKFKIREVEPELTMNFKIALLAALLSAALTATAFAQRNLRDIPDPDPELERKSFVVADGFDVDLFAADPKIAKPIHMNFDARGRLWIASSEVYPHIKPGQEATDKILVLEDTDADGRADKTTVFADGLLIPTGILPGDGGVYVANSTQLLHLSDTDGDGRADKRRIVLSGFGTEDTHHLLHTLRWGHDGCLYMNQSIYIHSHIETPYGVRRLNGGGIWRFRPETLELEIFCRGFVNPWGHHQDRWGQHFATDGAYGEGINYVFPGAVFVTAPGAKRRLRGLNPGSPKHCGLEIVSGRHLPADWQGSMITNDFRAHRVCRFVVSEDGSGYASRQEVEVIKSNHVAFRPIDVKMGPDGAIYIADWYNPIIQHGEVDFRDPRRDHVHGRIWRVTAKGRPLVERPKIVGASIEELLKLLKADENWVRLWAKRELIKHNADEVALALEKEALRLSGSEGANVHHRLELLWACETINHVEPAFMQPLLASDDHRVRAAVVRTGIHWHDRMKDSMALFAFAVEDKHPRVRLEGVRGLARMKSPTAARLALRVLDQPMDRFLDFALWQTMRDLEPHWLPALQKGELDFGGNVEHLTFALKAVESPGVVAPLLKLIEDDKLSPERQQSVLALLASIGGPNELRAVLDKVLDGRKEGTAAQRAQLLDTLVEASRQRKVKPAGDLGTLKILLNEDNSALSAAAIRAAGAWKEPSLRGQLTACATDENADDAVRHAAIGALADLGGRESAEMLSRLAQSAKDPSDRIRAIAAQAQLHPRIAVESAVRLLRESKGAPEVQQVLSPLLARKGGPKLLADKLQAAKLTPDVAKLAIRAARSAPGDTSQLQQVLRTAGGLSGAPKEWSDAEIAALVTDVQQKGDPHRGEAVYRRSEMQCLKCHAIGGAGGKVGPDMISIGASAPVDYLVQSLVDPNAKVKENFHSVIVETDAGKIYSGIPVSRTENQLVLRDQNDQQVTIAVSSIEDEREGRSLMPEGLVEPLTRPELVDLTAFLSQLGKDGPFAVGKERVVRRWEKLIHTPEGHRRLNRTSHDTAATDDAALSWESAYSRVSGELPVGELARFVIHRGHDPVSFVRFELEVTTPGPVGFRFGDTGGLTLWVNGKPTPLTATLSLSLERGIHRLTLAINRQQRTAPLRVELVDVQGSLAQAELVSGK